MGIPLKVSDGLFAVAKQEAEAAERSITAQVEYWAKIGRAVETVLAHQELLTLKKAGDLLTPTFPTLTRRRDVHALLTKVAKDLDRQAIKKHIYAAKTPVYSSDPKHPGMIVQVLSDGTRTLGSMKGRQFVAAMEKLPK